MAHMRQSRPDSEPQTTNPEPRTHTPNFAEQEEGGGEEGEGVEGGAVRGGSPMHVVHKQAALDAGFRFERAFASAGVPRP